MAIDMMNFVSASGGVVNNLVGQGTNVLAETVDHYRTLVDEIGDTLNKRGEHQAGSLATTLASRIGDVSGYLRESNGKSLVDDAQQALRRYGWVAAAAGFAGGLLLSRGLKAANYTIPASWHNDDYVEENA